MPEGQFPAAPPQTPGFPSNPFPLIFEGFSTLNTKPLRNDIDDKEMFICDGWMPIGKSNLRVLPDIGPALYSTNDDIIWINNTGGVVQFVNNSGGEVFFSAEGSTRSIISFYFANIAETPIAVVLLSDGSLVQVNTTTGATIEIAPAGTIVTPSNDIGVSQSSGNKFVIIVAPQTNGYWIWNGTVLATAGTLSPEVTITNGGNGYTPTPTVTVSGGSGSGQAFSVTVVNGVVTDIEVTNPGSGYSITDMIVLTITDSSGSSATATGSIMPFGVQGTVVETFVGRAWVGNGPDIIFSAPESVTDFNDADGGGVITSQDSFLRVGFFGLKQANGFLYAIGDSSLNTISGVNTAVSSGTALTTLTNQNVDPQIGTPWKNSVQVFSRNVVFANSFGIHVSYGGAVTKISSPLDGIYNTVPNIGNFFPSSAVISIFGIQAYMLLYPVIDQYTGVQVNKLLMWDGQRWWTSQQGVPLVYVASQEINSILTAWGTDGSSIYPLFQQPTANSFLKVVQSKLWKDPGYFYTKTAVKLFGLFFRAIQGGQTSVYIDNENSNGSTSTGAYQLPVSQAFPSVVWINNTGGVVQFQNNSGQDVTFEPPGLSIFASAVAQNGNLLGMTMTTTDADDILSSLTLFTQIFQTDL